MKIKFFILRCSVSLLLSVGILAPAYAEFSCAPAGSPTKFDIENDPAFPQALQLWQKITASRYVEGDSPKSCKPFPVPGYEGYPTKLCSYSNADAGSAEAGANPVFLPLPAQVVLLDPSAMQLAMWSVHACKIKFASGPMLTTCLLDLNKKIKNSNGAIFPVVGSVVESICNSNPKFMPCKGPADKNRAPQDTLFRDGVSVGYVDSAPWHWTTVAISPAQYQSLFDTAKSDRSIDPKQWYFLSRVSAAVRLDWTTWRAHIKKPIVPDGVNPQGFDLDHAGWGIVSREVQIKACESDDNELMDAVVYSGDLKE